MEADRESEVWGTALSGRVCLVGLRMGLRGRDKLGERGLLTRSKELKDGAPANDTQEIAIGETADVQKALQVQYFHRPIFLSRGTFCFVFGIRNLNFTFSISGL